MVATFTPFTVASWAELIPHLTLGQYIVLHYPAGFGNYLVWRRKDDLIAALSFAKVAERCEEQDLAASDLLELRQHPLPHAFTVRATYTTRRKANAAIRAWVRGTGAEFTIDKARLFTPFVPEGVIA